MFDVDAIEEYCLEEIHYIKNRQFWQNVYSLVLKHYGISYMEMRPAMLKNRQLTFEFMKKKAEDYWD